MPEKNVDGVFSPPDAKSWLDYAVKIQQEGPERFEDAAKFLTTIISISLTLYLTTTHKIPINSYIIICWFAALFLAFLVVLPFKYTFSMLSAENIKQKVTIMVKRKRMFFITSAVLYFFPPLLFLANIYFTGSCYEKCNKTNVQRNLPVMQKEKDSGSSGDRGGKRN